MRVLWVLGGGGGVTRFWLVPEVAFVEGDFVFEEEGAEFVLERVLLVVKLLG